MSQHVTTTVQRSSSHQAGMITGCPECGAPAEIEWTTSLSSTDGCVEHLKILCINRHWFLLTGDHLPQ
jgi:hypothetical protein